MKSLQTILYDTSGRPEHDESYQVTKKLKKFFPSSNRFKPYYMIDMDVLNTMNHIK